MITLLVAGITWYLTKLYYTKTFLIKIKKYEDQGLTTAQCTRCSQIVVTSPENLRNPFYCLACK